MAWHTITLYSPTGVYIDQLRWKSIDVTLVERDLGVLTVGLFPEYSDALFQRDCRISYHRVPEGAGYNSGKMVGDTMWLVTARERVMDEHGQHTIVLICQHPNALLGRRVVAYDEGTAQADKSDVGSDNCYDYVNENFVAATDAARNLSSAHFVLDPRPAPTFGSNAPIAGSYCNVLEILQDITQASASLGVYMGFEVYVQQPPGPFRCRFYSKQRGTNRGFTSAQPIVVDPSVIGARANVREDWSSTVSVVYAGGEGKQDERVISSQEDATLSAQSPFGRAEFFESFNTADTSTLDYEAQGVLRAYRPRREFEGGVNPAAQPYGAVYDVDYTWGDIVGARFIAPTYANGVAYIWTTYQFDCRVNPVHIQAVRRYNEYMQEIGIDETIEIHLQSVASAS